jgi:short-subunit dehydrogenase
VPHLVERGTGYIVNTASIGGLAGAVISTPYVSTKHAVVGLSESLSLYLRPKGIGVSVLCPAGVATNILEHLRKAGTDESMWGRPNEGAGGGAGMQTAEQVADILLAAMDEDRFVVPTFPVAGAIGKRIEAIDRLATPR